jgi:hypothetical protein
MVFCCLLEHVFDGYVKDLVSPNVLIINFGLDDSLEHFAQLGHGQIPINIWVLMQDIQVENILLPILEQIY